MVFIFFGFCFPYQAACDRYIFTFTPCFHIVFRSSTYTTKKVCHAQDWFVIISIGNFRIQMLHFWSSLKQCHLEPRISSCQRDGSCGEEKASNFSSFLKWQSGANILVEGYVDKFINGKVKQAFHAANENY